MKLIYHQVTQALLFRLFVFVLVFLLAACGGGGGGDTSPTSPTSPTNPPSSDANLSALSISSGTLTPSFQSTELNYATLVSYSDTSVTVNATLADSKASIKVNGNSVSTPITLSVGSNAINVVVTAEDGTTKTYTIDVTREAFDSHASLSALTLAHASLDQIFQDIQTSYTASVNFLVNSVRVNATLSDSGASMTVNGVAASSGVDTAPIYLAEGSNMINIAVTAPGGGVTITYSIDITRQAAITFAQQPPTGAAATGEAITDNFGVSIAISGDTMVVGADRNDVTTGTSEDGAAYVFIRNNGSWTQQAKLIADNAGSTDSFGHSVAIDGDTIVVGAPNEDGSGLLNDGAAYVFTRNNNGVWTQQKMLKASDAAFYGYFGTSVSISGNSIAVGANRPSGTGEAYVFIRSNGNWSEQQALTASNAGAGDQFGKSVAIDGDTLVVGAPNEDGDANSTATIPNDNAAFAGAAYVFTRTNGVWSQLKYLKGDNAAPGDNFGDTVAISGSSIAVGATGRDASTGAVYVFTGSGSSWSQQPMLQASNAQAGDTFGYSIALSEDRLVVGADTADDNANLLTASGAVYVFLRNGATWSEQLYVKASDAASNDYFGSSVDIDGDTLVVGARAKSITGVNNAGAAYVFQ